MSVQETQPKTTLPVTLDDSERAHERIKEHLHYTPVLTCSALDKQCRRKFYFKAENFQKTGSFKVRGALNALSILLNNNNGKIAGVTCHTSGNHGQGLAWAAMVAWTPCIIVTPHNTPESKVRSLKAYGAQVVFSDPEPIARQAACDKICKEMNYLFIPSSAHCDVIAGQGTIALEFLQQVPQLDAILVTASAGGMAAGISIVAKALKPSIKIFIVEPYGKDMEASLRAGKRLWPQPPQLVETMAESIRCQPLGELTWSIVHRLVEKEVFTMKDEDMVEGMKYAFHRMKIVVESAAGAAVAAAMSEKMRKMDASLEHVGVILCGGNVDIEHLPW